MRTVTRRQQQPQRLPQQSPRRQSTTPPGREKKKKPRKGLVLGVLAALGVLGFVVVLLAVGGPTTQEEEQAGGGFALRREEAWPQAEDAGADDARRLTYATPDGTEAVLRVAEWGSPEAAERMLREQAEQLYASDGYHHRLGPDHLEVTGPDGERVGSRASFVGRGGEEEVAVRTDGEAFFATTTPRGHGGADFYDDLLLEDDVSFLSRR